MDHHVVVGAVLAVGSEVRDELGEAADGIGDEVAVGVDLHEGDVHHVGRVVELDAEEQGVGLDVGPGRLAVRTVRAHAFEQAAGGVDLAVDAPDILAQEDLMRGMRGVGLVLIDERRDEIGVGVHIVGGAEHAVRAGLVRGAGQHHEVGGAARLIQRIVGLERDHHRPAAALGGQIETVVEELAEQREEAVEGRRQAGIGRDVVDEQRSVGRDRRGRAGVAHDVVRRPEDSVGAGERALVAVTQLRVRGGGGGDGGGVVGGLVGDQVADDSRRRIDHEAAGAGVGGLLAGALEDGIRQARENLRGGAVERLSIDDAIELSIDLTETEGEMRIDRLLAALCVSDLRQDEFEIGTIECNAHGCPLKRREISSISASTVIHL